MNIDAMVLVSEEAEGEENYTSLKVTKKLSNRLKDLGKKGESYEDIIWRLIEGKGTGTDGNSDSVLAAQMRELVDRILQLENIIFKPEAKGKERKSK